MKRSAAAVGLSLSILAGACAESGSSSQEMSPITPTTETPTTTTTVEMPTPTYSPTEAGHFVMRLVDVRDQSDSSAEHAAEGSGLLQKYHLASERVEHSTLGEISVAVTDPIVVEIPESASTALCDASQNGTKREWRNLLALYTEVARGLADEQTIGSQFDTTIFDWRFDECHPDDKSGQAKQGGDVHIFDANVSTIEHEAEGHFLGLGHANSQRCFRDLETQKVPDFSRCTADEYGDYSTSLGTGVGDRDVYSGYHLAGMGVLGPGQIEVVTIPGVRELDALLEEGNGTKLIRIPADGHWLRRQIQGGRKFEGVKDETYSDEPQEFYYIELSARSRPPKVLKPICYELSRRDFERDPRCNPNDVSVKVIRAGDYDDTVNQYPHTILLDINPDSHERGIGQEDVGETFTFDGIQLQVLDMDNNEVPDGTGSARVRIFLPE